MLTKEIETFLENVEVSSNLANRINILGRLIGIFSLILLGVACGGNDGITVQDLSGTWKAREPGSYVQLNSDGTYRIAGTVNSLKERPMEQGLYTLEGTLFTFISSDESTFCKVGQTGTYQLEETEDNGVRMLLQEDDCRSRRHQIVTLSRVP